MRPQSVKPVQVIHTSGRFWDWLIQGDELHLLRGSEHIGCLRSSGACPLTAWICLQDNLDRKAGAEAFAVHEQFYPAVIYLSTDKICLAVMYNFVPLSQRYLRCGACLRACGLQVCIVPLIWKNPSPDIYWNSSRCRGWQLPVTVCQFTQSVYPFCVIQKRLNR